MNSNSDTSRAIRRCIAANIPFAYVEMHGKGEGRFYASLRTAVYDTDPAVEAFLIREFCLNPQQPPIMIPHDLSESQVLDMDLDGATLPPAAVVPTDQSTQYQDYKACVTEVIESLKCQGGKTVISRVISVSSPKDIIDVITQYFAHFPDTMRFVYFTPETGLWFGASPELLLDYDAREGRLFTMSLAGTRKADEAGTPWDAKNIEEHDYVTDYIVNGLKAHGLEVEVYDSTPLRFGQIEHLCDRIRAHGSVDAVGVLDSMSPTPALCGVPCRRAYEQILSLEEHRRLCYGGWVGVSDGSRLTAYVNLRSAFAKPLPGGGAHYNIYVGGGITAQSQVDEEWIETERKASALLHSLGDLLRLDADAPSTVISC